MSQWVVHGDNVVLKSQNDFRFCVFLETSRRETRRDETRELCRVPAQGPLVDRLMDLAKTFNLLVLLGESQGGNSFQASGPAPELAVPRPLWFCAAADGSGF